MKKKDKIILECYKFIEENGPTTSRRLANYLSYSKLNGNGSSKEIGQILSKSNRFDKNGTKFLISGK